MANTAWALATLEVRQEELLGAIAGRALVRLEQFNPQNLANTAWPFATLGVRQEELMGAIAGRALVRLEEFNPQNLANTAWAFAMLGVRQEELALQKNPTPPSRGARCVWHWASAECHSRRGSGARGRLY